MLNKYHLFKFSYEVTVAVVHHGPGPDEHEVTDKMKTVQGIWTCVCRHDSVAQARFQEVMQGHREHKLMGIQKEAIDCMLLEVTQ